MEAAEGFETHPALCQAAVRRELRHKGAFLSRLRKGLRLLTLQVSVGKSATGHGVFASLKKTFSEL